MLTEIRDNEIIKAQKLLKLVSVWAVTSSVIAVVLSFICIRAISQQQTHWLPICTSTEVTVGSKAYSSSYIKEIAKKVIDLRLNYNPDVVDERYEALVNLADDKVRPALKGLLSKESIAVKHKSISSVFYIENISVDTKHHLALVSGELQRTIHQLPVKALKRTYLVKFSFNNGLLSPISIKEKKYDKA